jgi:hypothetical protein
MSSADFLINRAISRESFVAGRADNAQTRGADAMSKHAKIKKYRFVFMSLISK